ncbi:hypothetical protein FB451DRAFT_1486375 [Mycena latifolia]|nr:hypothetical protein FB451DRAFT_1486375 [Mycena latifolia]
MPPRSTPLIPDPSQSSVLSRIKPPNLGPCAGAGATSRGQRGRREVARTRVRRERREGSHAEWEGRPCADSGGSEAGADRGSACFAATPAHPQHGARFRAQVLACDAPPLILACSATFLALALPGVVLRERHACARRTCPRGRGVRGARNRLRRCSNYGGGIGEDARLGDAMRERAVGAPECLWHLIAPTGLSAEPFAVAEPSVERGARLRTNEHFLQETLRPQAAPTQEQRADEPHPPRKTSAYIQLKAQSPVQYMARSSRPARGRCAPGAHARPGVQNDALWELSSGSGTADTRVKNGHQPSNWGCVLFMQTRVKNGRQPSNWHCVSRQRASHFG